MERKNAWETYDKSQEKKVMKLAEQYRQFISTGKTERECVRLTEKMAREAGYISLEEALTSGDTLKPGDKVYAIHKKKLAVLFQIGTEPLEKGMNILGAHIDSPRLDLKQNPLYEDGEMALLDTHYYGGIKKYQWAAIPLALHGVVARKDGTVVELVRRTASEKSSGCSGRREPEYYCWKQTTEEQEGQREKRADPKSTARNFKREI